MVPWQGWLRDLAKHPYSAEPPDIAGGERYDAVVKEEVETQEDRRIARADYARRLAALPPKDDPLHADYHWIPENLALQKSDPQAWLEKISRDTANYPRPS